MINSDNSIQININFTVTVHEYIYFIIQFDMRVCLSAEGAKNVSWPWLSVLRGWGSIYIYIYIYIWLVHIYIYVYIYELCVFLFIATLSQLIRTMVTLVSHSYDLFQLVLLVETAYTIVNMIQVINKEARAT